MPEADPLFTKTASQLTPSLAHRMQPPSRPNMLLLAMTLTTMALLPGSLAVPARERPLKPCPDGFQAVVVDGKQDCVCADYHVYWPHTGLCYPEFTRGPCGRGQQLAANDTGHAECRSVWLLFFKGRVRAGEVIREEEGREGTGEKEVKIGNGRKR